VGAAGDQDGELVTLSRHVWVPTVGADYIDDVDVVRAGGMKALFDGVCAPSTIGTLSGEFTFGHARRLESVLGSHLAQLASERCRCWPGRSSADYRRPCTGRAVHRRLP